MPLLFIGPHPHKSGSAIHTHTHSYTACTPIVCPKRNANRIGAAQAQHSNNQKSRLKFFPLPGVGGLTRPPARPAKNKPAAMRDMELKEGK